MKASTSDPMNRPLTRARARSGVPIGGLGTGSFEVRADGRLHDWQLFNNSPWAGRKSGPEAVPPMDSQDFVCAIRIQRPGQDPQVRLLHLPEADDFLQHHWYLSDNLYWLAWMKYVRDVHHRGEFPFAYLEYEDDSLELRLRLEVFSPFIPGDTKNSSIPTAFLTFHAENLSETPVEVSITIGSKNPCGAYSPDSIPHAEVTEPDDRVQTTFTADGVTETDSTWNGSMTLSCLQPDATWTTGAEARHMNVLWADLRRTGCLPNRQQQPDALEKLQRFDELTPDEQSEVETEILAGNETEPVYQDRLVHDPTAKGDRLGALLDRLFERNFAFRERYDHDISWIGKTDVSEDERREIMFKIITGHLSKVHAAAFVSGSTSLGPFSSGSVGFAMSWFYPNHLGTNDDELLGHRYEEWFASSTDVMKYVVANREMLETKTRAFRNLLYGTSAPTWLIDAVTAQLSTLTKSSFFVRDGRFGVWEGGPGCCGLQTLDVSYYWTSLVAHFFPSIQAAQQRLTASFQLSEDSPEWAEYAMAFAGNRSLFEKKLAEDPDLAENAIKRRDVLREIIAVTGEDPSGRIPHFFPASFDVVDAYHMIDLMPKFALQAYRDYLATGDEDLLREMWPKITLAMDHNIQFDPADKGLLYHYDRRQTGTAISSQTYDAWDFLGYSAYANTIWIAALSACEKIAAIVGDDAYAVRAADMRVKAMANIESLLWNGEYLDLWNDPIAERSDNCCMADQLSGQWYANACGLADVISAEKRRSCLQAIVQHNTKEEGLINGAYPDGPRVSIEGEMLYPDGTERVCPITGQADTPWTGTEYAVASLMLQEGMTSEGLKIVRHVFDRYHAEGMDWNHIECGGHYARSMSIWQVYMDLCGLSWNAPEMTIGFAPRINADRFNSVAVIPGAWLEYTQERDGGTQHCTIRCANGSREIRGVAVPIPEGWERTGIIAKSDGREVRADIGPANGSATVNFDDPLLLREGDVVTIVALRA
jgi:uncharacterized protein (DUF608 family)